MLIERTSDDVAAHAKAMLAFKLVSLYAYKHPPDFQDDGRFFGLDPDKVGLTTRFGLHDAMFLVGLHKPGSSVMAGAVWIFPEPLDNRFTRALVIYGMREFTEDAFRATVNSTKFMSTFVHEFIHLLDFTRTDNRIIKPYASNNEAELGDSPEYYNDHAELNAFFHTFAMNWLGCLHDINENPDDAGDLLSIYYITGEFEPDLRRLIYQSRQSRKFFTMLTPARRKSVMRRLYRLHAEIVRQAAKETKNGRHTADRLSKPAARIA